jgi:hypothetical protein
VSDDARPVSRLDRIAFTRKRRQFELLKVLPVPAVDLNSDSVHEPMIALGDVLIPWVVSPGDLLDRNLEARDDARIAALCE